MRAEAVSKLRCPACTGEALEAQALDRDGEEIVTGVVWCQGCRHWFPIEDGALDMLVGALASADVRRRFWTTHERALLPLNLAADETAEAAQRTEATDEDVAQALQQQKHFDWYVSNNTQSYSEYEATPFWRAADRIAFDPWKAEIRATEGQGRWLLDVGCAQGRSTAHMLDLDLNIVAFDISSKCVRDAARRYRQGRFRARASFIAADASAYPFRNDTFDYVLIYGVLHHLANPGEACSEVGRVLKPGGVYFGQENNRSCFRVVFDVLQKVWPIWHEEAGPEAVISDDRLTGWLTRHGFRVSFRTSVFVPPHVINWTNEASGFRILTLTDRLISAVPGLRRHGGLVIFEARK